MGSLSQPNILLVVLDACRLDCARNYAPALRELGERGVWFENAIAPGTWTQPSHASIFTGEYPHVHGVTQPSQEKAPTNLFDSLSERGYRNIGVSGNGFLSPLWAFDRAFDEFRYTQTPEPFELGMDTYTFLRNHQENATSIELLSATFRAALGHERPARSLANLASVSVNVGVRRVVPQLTRIPHQTFAPNPQHAYSPEKNTTLLERAIRREADADQTFFAFANYMDTHRPYRPPPDLQREYLGETLSESELQRLNDNIAAPWEFVRLVQDHALDENDVEMLQQLYMASVKSVDRHLERLVDALVDTGIREETIVVVVGDHGENLGETDSMGRRRFGHEASISDALARVPLVISNPALETNPIDDFASLKDIYDFLLTASNPQNSISDLEPKNLIADRVLCEYPALADRCFYDRYPDIDRATLDHRVQVDSVAAYQGNWRLVLESTGNAYAEQDGESVEPEDTPDELQTFASNALADLETIRRADVSAETADRLEDLGYV